MQLARPAPALLLGGAQRVAQPLGLDRLRIGDGRRRARREGLQQLLVIARERAGAREAVERDQQPQRAAAEDERDE